MHNIDLDKIEKLSGSKIQSTEDINVIVYTNGLYSKKEDTYISVGDILGYDYKWRISSSQSPNILSCFSSYFDRKGMSYQTRSIGMLDYSSEEVITALMQSFKREPIVLSEADEGKYVVSSNGLHRYTILRLHYLNEISKASSEEEKLAIKEKYKIPVKVEKIDYIKTYCNYLLDYFFDIKIRMEYDDNNNYTGNVVFSEQKTKRIMNDIGLLEFTSSCFQRLNPSFIETIRRIIDAKCRAYPSFQKFIQDNFSEIFESKKGRNI